MKYPRKWEDIDGYTRRLRVPGGWLVHSSTEILVSGKPLKSSDALCFVEDKDHEWELE